jgi:hypothetical protein
MKKWNPSGGSPEPKIPAPSRAGPALPLRRIRNDDEKLESNHPLSEDVSPPVFAIVALTIIVICVAAFGLLGMFP